jgi:hypothetical protein
MGVGKRKEPELIIGYDVNHLPTASVCSACGARMPHADPTLRDSQDVILWFLEAFALHLEQRHLTQKIN